MKPAKSCLHLLLLLALALAWAPDARADQETVDGLTWNFTVSDGGAELAEGTVPQDTIGAIAIPSSLGGYPVTSIGEWAFEDRSGLTDVTIPDSVTIIRDAAFCNCGLTNVTIGGSVTTIGEYAFSDCHALAGVTIPDTVTNLGYGAFLYCNALASVTIGHGVPTIDSGVFEGCSSLASLALGNGVTNIGFNAFYGCTALASISVAAGNPQYSSANGLLLSKDGTTLVQGVNGVVTIPDGVTSIEELAFYQCSGLRGVTIPGSVTSIGNSAFSDCNGLTGVTLPNSVTNIGYGAFYGCSGLRTLSVPGSWEGSDMLEYAGVPEGCNVIYRQETLTTPVPVPHSWLEENAGSLLAELGGDYEAAAGAMAPIGRPVWECYLTGAAMAAGGTDFDVAFRIGDDGKWIVEWTPDLNDGLSQPVRKYRIEGKRELLDENWTDVTGEADLSTAGWNYFRVGVSLP